MPVSTIKLQSPAWNGAIGEQIALPVSQDSFQGAGLADILTLFGGDNKILDFGQLREVVQLVGFLTPNAATDAGFENPVHMRDVIRHTRTAWPTQDGTVGGAQMNWSNVPGEADSYARGTGVVRLVYEKAWDPIGHQYVNMYVYGSVGDYNFGPRLAASGRVKIPFVIHFLAGNVQVGR